MTVRLDTREARPLTSREITKILGGILGGIAESGVGADRLRRATELALNFLRSGEGSDKPFGLPQEQGWVAAFGGASGGLMTWCQKEAITEALAWTLENWGELFPRGTPQPN